MDKSKLFFSNTVSPNIASYLSHVISIPIANEFGVYLGMSLLYKPVSKQTFGLLVDLVKKELSNWKGRLLYMASKSVLLQAFTSSIASYAMQTTKIPVSILEQINKVNRCFLWGETDGQRKLHSVSWEQVCQPKELGELGLKDLCKVNKVALARLA